MNGGADVLRQDDFMNRDGQASLTAEETIAKAAAGDPAAWQDLACAYRDRLRRMIALRLDPRLRGRVDPSDLVQEAFLDANNLLADYQLNPPLPFYLWLRQLAGTRLAKAHRHHLGALCRDVRREVAFPGEEMPGVSSVALAGHLASREARPSEAALQAELRARLEKLLDQFDPLEHEILVLRHFEQLSNAETARVLGLTEAAASKRYIRALERIRERLAQNPEGWVQ
jgi:RNA polymerase sigma-70 factor, ECF subfamily